MDEHYSYLLVVGSYSTSPLFSYDNWCHISKCLWPLIQRSKHRPWLDVRQEEFPTGKPIKFGRLSWKPESFKKWTHEVDGNSDRDAHWNFLDLEVWCPSLYICERDDIMPDLLLSMSNKEFFKEPRRKFDYALMVAASLDAYERSLVDDAKMHMLSALDERSKVLLRAQKVDGWFTGDENERVAAVDYLIVGIPGREWLDETPRFDHLPESHNWTSL